MQRLTSHQEFVKVLRQGRKLVSADLVLHYLVTTDCAVGNHHDADNAHDAADKNQPCAASEQQCAKADQHIAVAKPQASLGKQDTSACSDQEGVLSTTKTQADSSLFDHELTAVFAQPVVSSALDHEPTASCAQQASSSILDHELITASSEAHSSPSFHCCGYAVSKQVGNAVVRNHVKRRLRVLVAKYEDLLPRCCDLVVRARPTAKTAKFASLDAQIRSLFNRLAKNHGFGR